MDQCKKPVPSSPYSDLSSGMNQSPPPAYHQDYYSGPAPAQAPVPAPVQMPNITTVITNQPMASGGAAGFGCPVCHSQSFTGTYSCCAWLCCLCVPILGLICCLCSRKKKCSKCGFKLA